jgi:hypothetical protein
VMAAEATPAMNGSAARANPRRHMHAFMFHLPTSLSTEDQVEERKMISSCATAQSRIRRTPTCYSSSLAEQKVPHSPAGSHFGTAEGGNAYGTDPSALGAQTGRLWSTTCVRFRKACQCPLLAQSRPWVGSR